MAQTPKRRKKKRLDELSGPELAEKLLGKPIKKALDKKIEEVDSKGVPKFMQTSYITFQFG